MYSKVCTTFCLEIIRLQAQDDSEDMSRHHISRQKYTLLVQQKASIQMFKQFFLEVMEVLQRNVTFLEQ